MRDVSPPGEPPAPPAPRRRGLVFQVKRFALRRAEALAEATRDPVGRSRRALAAAGRARLERMAAEDPARALRRAARARRFRPRDRVLAEAEALLTAEAAGWAAAAPFFARIAAAQDLQGPSARDWAAFARPGAAVDLALPDPDRPVSLPPEIAAKIVLYTACFGDMAPPAALFQPGTGLRALCLADRDLAVPGWETVRIAPPGDAHGADPRRALARCRIRAHEVLAGAAPGAEASLFVDPGRIVTGNLHCALMRWLWPQDLALWRHPAGTDWQAVAAARLLAGAEAADAVLAAAGACDAAGLPRDAGAWDAGVIWRRHGDPGVVALMEAWWTAAAPHPGAEDLALCRVLGAAEAPAPPRTLPRTLPGHLGPAGDNIFFAAHPRRAARTVQPVSGRRRITFVYAERYATSASTYLRGAQLSAMIAERFPDLYEVEWTAEPEGLADRVVVMTKGALQVATPEALEALRRRNVAVIGSWDDIVPDPAKVAATDAIMAISYRQMLDLGRLHPGTPVHLVSHHVNRQVPRFTPPADRLRTGYFGELANTVRPQSLAGMVELVGINTSKIDVNWLDELPRFNCHWILRRKKPKDGWKPFLKGFLAARCGAVIVVGRDEDDALQYLGDDYPFFVRGFAPGDLEADMAGLAAAYGGPEWRRAQEIMAQVAARSTDEVVCAEFRAMIAAVAG